MSTSRSAAIAAPIAAQSISDTAVSIGVSRSMLYELIKEGRGPRVVKIGRRTVVLVEDRDSWLRSLARGIAPENFPSPLPAPQSPCPPRPDYVPSPSVGRDVNFRRGVKS